MDFPENRIDPRTFTGSLQKHEVQERLRSPKERQEGMKVIVAVDGLDHIECLTQNLNGFDTFLDDHPYLQIKVVLIQIAVPSREAAKT
ncbi:hypothetical protein N7535_001382 [Penicillium sp. DV-2018c]|nr:hypothetical protein N7535_001382 [Penicillium sp. DV-2018c]